MLKLPLYEALQFSPYKTATTFCEVIDGIDTRCAVWRDDAMYTVLFQHFEFETFENGERRIKTYASEKYTASSIKEAEELVKEKANVRLFCPVGVGEITYTQQQLEKINPSYFFSSRSYIEIEKINKICKMLESSRRTDITPTIPQDGDRVICVNPAKGEISGRGYLEKRESSGILICVHTSVDIFIGTLTENGEERVYTSAGGGNWRNFTNEQFKDQAVYEGETLSMFVMRNQSDGAIRFLGKVYYWKVIDPHF